MSLPTQTSPDGSTLTIVMPDRFDFKVHRDLREAYEKVEKRCSRYVLDLRNTRYVDSSALGMLLQLREHAGGRGDSVRISNADAGVRDILKIANFHKLMTIE